MGPSGPDAVNSLARVQRTKGPDAGIKDARVFCNLPQGLTELYCSSNKLTSLDNLPQGLTELNCSMNKLTSLDNLPQGLTKLDCSDNQLTSLYNLPQGLTKLDCSDNNLINLDNLAMVQRTEGPDAVNSLARVPKGPDAGIKDACVFCNLPQSLTYLDCSKNQLTSLDNLPQGLTELRCSNNKLTSLDNLPQSLTKLICWNNQLTSLDIANCHKLEYLNCGDNNFPEEMETILNNNNLTIQEKINKLIDGCLIPYDNSFVLK